METIIKKQEHKTGFAPILLLFFLLLVSCKPNTEEAGTGQPMKISEDNIRLSEAQIQLANIKVSPVHEGFFGYNRLYTAVLKVDEESAVNISSRATGRITKLFFNNAGETVNKGDSLYQFYCEDLIAAERQYFTLQSNNWNFSGRYEPSLELENKLLLFGMLPSQISTLKKDGKILFSVTIHSPVKGVIRAINIIEGQYVDAGQALFELADDSKLWVEAQVSPEDLEFLKVGMQSIVAIPDAGSFALKGKVSFINPLVEQGKNVIVIRSIINNLNRKLLPGMLATLQVQCKKKRCVVVPASSVIRDKKGTLVWVRNEDGTFSAREIKPGIQSQDSVQILSGLNQSDRVVTSGAYLLNSEFIWRKSAVAEM